ncbi:MAG TPA: thermonuclease family protein [Urbifossiella sp.]|nr:thermonuclease family protein [Urbifossiella sp.]
MKHLITLVLLLIASPLLAADPITGRVVGIADGDTLTVLDTAKTRHKVRLHGIDAPEKAQAFGTKAKEALAALVFQKDVTVTVVDEDRYGRQVGKVMQGGTDVNTALVRAGYAWRYATYDKKGEYTAAQDEAKVARRGLWADPGPTPPWEFRRKK